MGRADWLGGAGVLGDGGGDVTTDTVTVRPRAGVAGARVTRRAGRAARRVTLARERAGRARGLFGLGVARFDFLDTAPTQGATASQSQSAQDINLPILPTELWARLAVQGAPGAQGGSRA